MNAKNTSIYKEYVAMGEEVDKHKWYESEKAGRDIGFVQAMIDWTIKFKTEWVKKRNNRD